MPSDSDRILAEGVPIELIDGRKVSLRFTMRSLKMLEDAFGNLDAADQALASDKVVNGLTTWLAAGLVHEGITQDELLDVLRTDRPALSEYGAAIRSAAAQAMGESSGPKAKGRSRSTGRGGTTPPPLSSVEPMTSSGT